MVKPMLDFYHGLCFGGKKTDNFIKIYFLRKTNQTQEKNITIYFARVPEKSFRNPCMYLWILFYFFKERNVHPSRGEKMFSIA